MKVIYSEDHRLHNPRYEFTDGVRKEIPETPARVDTIKSSLEQGGHPFMAPPVHGMDALRLVHSENYLKFLAEVYDSWVEGGGNPEGVIPDTFASRGRAGHLQSPDRLAGYYCFDTSSPIVKGTFPAACSSAGCALTGAELLLSGEPAAYALCRPPGHHAGADYYGGFCFLNNAALAAERLRSDRNGRVAILDLDYHHGNGTQDIFYGTNSVFFASLHRDPREEYPFFWGSAEETGEGDGEGFNLNLPLPGGCDEACYLKALDKALNRISTFGAEFMVLSLGVDTFRGDPLGTFFLEVASFGRMGKLIQAMGVPTLIVQEGGYNVAELGMCVSQFLSAW
jgi:acetoin utilization deacetylase AcuC-like enzyme